MSEGGNQEVAERTVVVTRIVTKPHRCIARGCKSLRCSEDTRLRYFRLPVDEQRRNIWLTSCDREDLKSHPVKSLVTKVLCQLHFQDSQFMNPHNYQRLIWNALPTLFGSHTRKPEEFKSLTEVKPATESQDHAYTTLVGPAHREYMLKCAELRRELAEKKRQVEPLEKYQDAVLDDVVRQAKLLPQDKWRALVDRLLALHRPIRDTELVSRLWQEHEVPLEPGEGEDLPRVRVEVLLLCKERPGCALLGLRTNCSTARGLYQPPGDFVRFGYNILVFS